MSEKTESPLSKWIHEGEEKDIEPAEAETTETKAEETKTEEGPPEQEEKSAEEKLILGKFKTHEELEKAYPELEKVLGKQGQKIARFNKLSQQWVNSETGEPLDENDLWNAIDDAMLKTHGPKEEPKKEEAEDEEFIDPAVKKLIEKLTTETKELKGKLNELSEDKQQQLMDKAQKEVDEIAAKLQKDFKVSQLLAFKAITIAGPKGDPAKVVEELLEITKKDHETYVKGKKLSASQGTEKVGKETSTAPKTIRFDAKEKKIPNAVTPLSAWIAQDQ